MRKNGILALFQNFFFHKSIAPSSLLAHILTDNGQLNIPDTFNQRIDELGTGKLYVIYIFTNLI